MSDRKTHYEVIFRNSADHSAFVLASVAFATIVGSVTFTGSFIAFGKSMKSQRQIDEN